MPGSASPTKSQSQKARPASAKKCAPSGGADIRSFFGGSQNATKKAPPASETKPTGTGKRPIVIDESDEELEQVETKPQPKPSTAAKASTSKHFPTDISSKQTAMVIDSSPEPATPKRSSPRKPAPRPGSKPTPSSSKRKALAVSSDDELSPPPVKRPAPSKKKAPVSSDSEDYKPAARVTPTTKAKAKPKPKAKQVETDSESEDESEGESEEETKPKPKPKAKAPAKKPAAKAPSKAKAKAKDGNDDDKPAKPKFDFRAAAAARAAGPRAPGSKDIPNGKPGCLAGLTFVFTGELESLGRDDAVELAKRYMGRVTGAPSGKTSYVVVGENAGASKLEKIQKLKVATINEDEFLELIRTREGELDDKQKAALQKEEQKILDQAKALEQREAEDEKMRKRKEKALEGTGVATKKVAPASSQLWTTKYAPTNLKEICGNKGQVEKLNDWLTNWNKNFKSGFKKPGKDGSGLYRAVLISGPPGIGKTTSAHLMAKAAGYAPLELNASDARSKKLVENATNVDNTSLDGFFQGKGVMSTTVTDVKLGSRTCLIMDEVDGMSAGDRGGVGALNTLIKKTKIPMILICNDRSLPKMKPLWGTTFSLPFRRPSAQEIRSRILSILYKEKLKIPSNVVDELVKGVNSDIRQVLNMLSTYKLGKSEMDFDEGKHLIKTNEKNTIMTPFTIIDKLTGPYAFSRTSKEKLGDRMELYFHDISFVPLFMQEHYLKTNPSSLTSLDGPEKVMKNLELISKAADSISDGDLVDRMIHGSEQHWSLLPLHAVTSTVSPASYIYGASRPTPGGGWGGPAFPQWLGQNSKQTKLGRQLTDIQIRMRLRASGGRDEVRLQYMPLLASKIVTPLTSQGQDAIEDTIETMDEYYLGKDDWDAFVELGVDTMRDELILKKIPTAVKTAFTRNYNKRDHPIAFHKADMFAASKKKIVDAPAPDNEDVFEEDDAPPDDEADGGDDENVNDYTKDKLIKAVKPKGKGKKK